MFGLFIYEEKCLIDAKNYLTSVFSHDGSSNIWTKIFLNYFFQLKMRKDLAQDFTRLSRY